MSTVRSLSAILLREKNQCTSSSKIRYRLIGDRRPQYW